MPVVLGIREFHASTSPKQFLFIYWLGYGSLLCVQLKQSGGHHEIALCIRFPYRSLRVGTPEQIFVQASPSVVVIDIFDAKGKSIGQGSGVVFGAGRVWIRADGRTESGCGRKCAGEPLNVCLPGAVDQWYAGPPKQQHDRLHESEERFGRNPLTIFLNKSAFP